MLHVKDSAEDSLFKESIIELPEPGDEVMRGSPRGKNQAFLTGASMHERSVAI